MADKLTNGKTVSIRFSAPGTVQLEAMASSMGLEVSDYIRHLVASDVKVKQRQFLALQSIFGGNSGYRENSSQDDVMQALTPSQFGDLGDE
jgi:hypothetical protein